MFFDDQSHCMTKKPDSDDLSGSSPAGRGGAGVYIEGELGAFYLLAMLAGTKPRGLPGARLSRVAFQGADRGFALDDLILHGATSAGDTLLEIQSKRTVTFATRDQVFKEVCEQIASSVVKTVGKQSHLMAVATQRTSHAISGPYQDVLEWARVADNGMDFFKRLRLKGVAGKQMRTFSATFRRNLIDAGIADDDELIWGTMRRFQILEFDFESSSPLAKTYALMLARMSLAAGDASKVGALWEALIAISIGEAKSGGSLTRDELRSKVTDLGFNLSGDTRFEESRAKLAELSRQALQEIGGSVAGVSLSRTKTVEALNSALDEKRYIQIRGDAGVGKSAVLRTLAQRVACEAHIVVLDPLNTPKGGWSELALRLDIRTTAKEFLIDLAASGGGTLFIDSLEMFASPSKRRTVNDLLREVAAIDGFTVVVTARSEFGADGDDWLAEDAVSVLGAPAVVTVAELDPEEMETLSEQAPQLRALLAPEHPAAAIARNLYRLSRLVKSPEATNIRTEAALADSWWKSADYAPIEHRRAAQRIMAELADQAFEGSDVIELREDPPAREHLLQSQTLTEVRRDQLGFYHDVLRDWAVGARLAEDPATIAKLALISLASPRVARGVEFAARFLLEAETDCSKWLNLLDSLSPVGAHSSWRRHALLAIVRSEISPVLLEHCTDALLAKDCCLLLELISAIVAVETESSAEFLRSIPMDASADVSIPNSLRVVSTPSGPRLLQWCFRHCNEMPIGAIGPIIKLVEVVFLFLSNAPHLGQPTARMLFNWLLQLDVRDAVITISQGSDINHAFRDDRRRLVGGLRTMALLLSSLAPDQLKTYLREIAKEKDHYKLSEIRSLSASIAPSAPQELADMVAASLIDPRETGRAGRTSRDSALSHEDSRFLPPSPAQAPFLDLLDASPNVGLGLIHRLVDESVKFFSDGEVAGSDSITLNFEDGERSFPWVETYFWSRDQAREYSTASGLMALEAWGHQRIDAGEDISAVLSDLLGPSGSAAAYLLVAVDVLISHWPATRDHLVPFVTCPELLAIERGRRIHDEMARGGFNVGDEPKGRVRLADLQAKPSRGVPLENLLPNYLNDDDTSNRVRALLDDALVRLGSYEKHENFGDPAFMCAYARNLLNSDNWTPVEGGRAYQPPKTEADHLAQLNQKHSAHMRDSEIGARISLATRDSGKGSAELSKEAAIHMQGALPDGNEPDYVRTRSLQLVSTAFLVVRDGDDALLGEQEAWVREVISLTLTEKTDSVGERSMLQYSRPALATLALIYLWRRRGRGDDRNELLALASRKDGAAAMAFSDARNIIEQIDARFIKSVMRIGFTASRYRWHPWDEDAAQTSEYEQEKRVQDLAAVSAEKAWLDGGEEPDWPPFPVKDPSPRSRNILRVPGGRDDDVLPPTRREPVATIHADSQSAARWLGLVTDEADSPSWCREIVGSYSEWSAVANGFGHPAEAKFDQMPQEWNNRFYQLVANEMLTGSDRRFDELIQQIERLPDKTFGDVCETLIHAADVWYFNGPSRSPDRPVSLRQRLISRVLELRRWTSGARPGDLGIDHDTGGVVAKLLMNTHSFFVGTKSYLVPAIFDRIDPLLETVRPMMSGGPTQFVALCTMNTLLIEPRARHLDFILASVGDWHALLPTDTSMWVELGTGRKVLEWLNAAATEDPTILMSNHPSRSIIDLTVGRLIVLGVGEAHEFERRVGIT
jgi:hypothetical protein|tara:strand:+ start:2537 stop:7657 length:5121 start_codon:yes stop_codon:yes gene_type:complete